MCFYFQLVGHVIKGGGIAISGQEQRQLGGGFLEGEGAPQGQSSNVSYGDDGGEIGIQKLIDCSVLHHSSVHVFSMEHIELGNNVYCTLKIFMQVPVACSVS